MTQIIDWKPEYETGNFVIDYQHKRLVNLINNLNDINQNSDLNQSLLPVVIEELFLYTKYHFDTEEKIMQKTQYTGLRDHKILHSTFIDNLTSFKTELDSQEKDMPSSLLAYLSDWLIAHIQKEDVKIIKELMAGGGAV